MGIIYLARNIKNDKKYVGYTGKTLERRRKEHEDDAWRTGGSWCFQRALAKYGTLAFEWRVLCHTTDDNWQERERQWIKFMESKAPNGYNLTDGGDGIPNMSQEIRDKISKANKGRSIIGRKPLSPETRMKISKTKKEHPCYHTEEFKERMRIFFTGRVFTEEHRRKISEAKTGKKGKPRIFTEEHKRHLSEAAKRRFYNGHNGCSE